MFDEQWTIQAVRDWGDWQLEPYIHDQEERLAQIDYLLTGMMDWNYAQLANNLNTVLEDEKRLRFMVAVRANQGWSTSAIRAGSRCVLWPRVQR